VGARLLSQTCAAQKAQESTC